MAVVGYNKSMKRFTTPIIDVKKYGGKQVAIVRGKIVASGRTSGEVLEKARQKFPRATWRDILIVGVPRGITVIYRL